MRSKISILFFVLCILLGMGAGYCFSTTKPKENVPIAGTIKLTENVPTVGTIKSKENVLSVSAENKTREGWTVPQTGEKERQKDFITALFCATLSFFSISACIRYKLNQVFKEQF